MSKEFLGRIRHKKDTSANWTSKNPVLLDGELIMVTTNSGETRFKIGDGVKTYTQLPFQDEVVRNSISSDFYTKTEVDEKFDSVVEKEDGKGLSTNDFTTAYKTKLDGIASGANNYSLPTATASVLGGVKVGSGLSIDGGVLNATPGRGFIPYPAETPPAQRVPGALYFSVEVDFGGGA